jgi:hypothetical protein
MPDAAWRCSQCGTVNAPAANACRTCGHWPSLFDLEASTVESQPSTAPAREEPDVYRPETVDLEALAPEPVTVEVPEAELPPEFGTDATTDEATTGRQRGWQRFARLVVPIGVAIYVLVSVLVDR